MSTKALVLALRQSTGAGLLHCKQALEHSKGDLQLATAWLLERGSAIAANKAKRETLKGAICVGISPSLSSGILMEVNVESDFCARGEQFHDFTRKLIPAALAFHCNEDSSEPILFDDEFLNKVFEGKRIADHLDAISTLKENIRLRRMSRVMSQTPGMGIAVVGSYVHNRLGESRDHGTLATMAGLQTNLKSVTDDQKDELHRIARQLSQHITAEMDSEIALMQQTFVLQDEFTVSDWLAEQKKKVHCDTLDIFAIRTLSLATA